MKPAQEDKKVDAMRCERRASAPLGAANVHNGNSRHGVALIDGVKYWTFVFLHWFSIRYIFNVAVGS